MLRNLLLLQRSISFSPSRNSKRGRRSFRSLQRAQNSGERLRICWCLFFWLAHINMTVMHIILRGSTFCQVVTRRNHFFWSQSVLTRNEHFRFSEYFRKPHPLMLNCILCNTYKICGCHSVFGTGSTKRGSSNGELRGCNFVERSD